MAVHLELVGASLSGDESVVVRAEEKGFPHWHRNMNQSAVLRWNHTHTHVALQLSMFHFCSRLLREWNKSAHGDFNVLGEACAP